MLSKIMIELANCYREIKRNRKSIRQKHYDNCNVSSIIVNSLPLTSDEKSLIKDKWGDIIHCIPRGYQYYRGIKALCGFSPDYLPSSYFYPYIEGILNPYKFKRQLCHKSMLQMVYGLGIKHPSTLIRTYGGVFLDGNYKPLTECEAIKLIRSCNYPLLYKPSIDSEAGHGIRLIEPNDFDDLCNEIKSGKILMKNADFVLQYLVEQSCETSVFNPSSLNCMRVTTLNLNGNISVGSRALKCGPKGSVVDNIGSGKRGVIVGINPDGILCEKGFYGNGEIAYGHNDVLFKGMKIDDFYKVVDSAIALHKLAPACKMIGWDIALDANNDPVLIEGNVVYPGISFEQMCSGPIFGDRTDEFISFIKKQLIEK